MQEGLECKLLHFVALQAFPDLKRQSLLLRAVNLIGALPLHTWDRTVSDTLLNHNIKKFPKYIKKKVLKEKGETIVEYKNNLKNQ